MEVVATATLSAVEFSERFADLWKESAFRLEMLDFYVAANEQEPFARFQAGQPQDLSWRGPWRRLVSAATAAGKQMRRVHVVTEPLTPYVEFELTCAYPTSVAAGEDVRILPRREIPEMHLPSHDYWLFDQRTVALLNYNERGDFLTVDFTDDATVVERHCRWRDVALGHATLLQGYLESRNLKGLVAADAT